jgi:hypothetical protein
LARHNQALTIPQRIGNAISGLSLPVKRDYPDTRNPLCCLCGF